MKLSIIIPVYNAEKYLAECLESIIPEMNEEIELLLLDDGSKDGSYAAIQKIESENVRVFHHENHGVSFTRNYGIREAKGDYVMFVDADDKLSSGWGKTVLKGCTENADVIYYSKNIIPQSSKIGKIDVIHSIFGILNETSQLGNMSSPCSKLYRRELLLNNKIYFDEGLINGEDGLFNLSVVLHADSYQFNARSFYQYRIYIGSSSRHYNDKFYDSNIRYLVLAQSMMRNAKIDETEISRCIEYAATYSVYLYLFLASTLENNEKTKKALDRLSNGEDILKYPVSKDCNKVIQMICILVQRKQAGMALNLVRFRNYIRKKQKCEIKWELI